MRDRKYKVTVNFVECPSEDDRKTREDKIVSILVDSAIEAVKKKNVGKEKH
ncbi:hypothetical protein ACFL38_01155 [Candidatus Omnitrophota bacterium]